MLFIIFLLISFAVQVYSIGYLKEDPFLLRFLSYLNFFTFFMFLVISNNLLQAFLGWEGVGLVLFY
jgi:NADH-quinone oxidoreductase subunit L